MLIIFIIMLFIIYILYIYNKKSEYYCKNIRKKYKLKQDKSIENDTYTDKPLFDGININLEMAKNNNIDNNKDINNIINNNIGADIKDIYDKIIDNKYIEIANNIEDIEDYDKYYNQYKKI